MRANAIATRRRIPGKAVRELLLIEAKIAIRAPVGLVLGVAVPLILLIILGSIPALTQSSGPASVSPLRRYVPVLICMVLTMIALVSLPIPLVINREQGWLRRISTTPVGPAWLLVAQGAVNLVLVMMATVVIVAGAALGYGVPVPAEPLGFVVSFALGTAALIAIGLLIGAIAPSAPIAGVLGTVLLYPMLFLAGLWVPRESLAPMLQTIADYTPLAAAAQAMESATQGAFPSLLPLAVMVVYAIVAGAAAVRFFRWE